MSKEHPPKILDLPTEHLTTNGRDYVPLKTRDSVERDRLHDLPTGTLLLEDQLKGIDVMKALLPVLESPTDLQYASDMFAASLLNASWYQYGQSFEGMRRHLELETMLDENGNYLSQVALIEKIVSRLDEVSVLASAVTQAHVERRVRRPQQAKLGRAMGNVASSIASIGMGPISEGAVLYDVKLGVRNNAQRAIRLSRTDTLTHGARPSVAQFANRDSDALQAWRRDATDSAYQAMEAAYASIEA
jgi:hypothetical protein